MLKHISYKPIMRQDLGSNIFYPQLDGLRGIAILMVIEWHYHLVASLLAHTQSGLAYFVEPILSLGWSGVDLFFVLSGFLLGGILLDRKGASNYFKAFYTRRACRILPLYFIVVGVFFILPAASSTAETVPLWAYLTFTQNIAMAQQGDWGSDWLTPTWSLAVEEQFYLILPFLVWSISRKRLPYVLAGLILLAPLLRICIITFASYGDFAFYILLPSRAESLYWGVLGAWIMRNPKCLAFLNSHRKSLYAAIVMLTTGVCLLVLGPYRHWTPDVLTTYFPPTYGYTLLSLLYLCVLLTAVTEKRGLISFVTRNQLLAKIGIISYGVYLLHIPVQLALLSGAHHTGLLPVSGSVFYANVGALLLTLALASVSWIFFERRIVNWGRSFNYQPTISS